MRCCRLSASDCATDTLSTKPTNEINSAGNHSEPTDAIDTVGNPSCGRPWGTVPTMLTPAVWSQRMTATKAVDTITASMGASLDAISARRGLAPRRPSHGDRDLRASTRNNTLPAPMPSVTRLVAGAAWASCTTVSKTSVPPALTPSRCFTCPTAMSTAEPEIKPLITGWLRKLARKPSRNTPNSSNMPPESSDSSMASAT